MEKKPPPLSTQISMYLHCKWILLHFECAWSVCWRLVPTRRLAPPVTPGGQTRGCPSFFETQQEQTSGLLHNHLKKTMSTQRIIKRQTDLYIFNKFAQYKPPSGAKEGSSASAEGWFSNQNIGQIQKIYIFCLVLLFTSSSPCRKDQFAVLWFSTRHYCTDPGLQLVDPAPLNGLSLRTCWYFSSEALQRTKRAQQSTMGKKICFSVHPRNFGCDAIVLPSVRTSAHSCKVRLNFAFQAPRSFRR